VPPEADRRSAAIEAGRSAPAKPHVNYLPIECMAISRYSAEAMHLTYIALFGAGLIAGHAYGDKLLARLGLYRLAFRYAEATKRRIARLLP
jgi:hypothetical protein